MDDKITLEELKSALVSDIDRLCREVVDTVNKARPGQIITDSEEPVRDAHAEFRRQVYQKALELRQRHSEPAFSPWGHSAQTGMAQQGQADNQLSDNQRQG